MADIRAPHAASAAKTEGDGISYRGIGWFLLILVITTVGCQGLMFGLFTFIDHQVAAADPDRAALAPPVGMPTITDDRVVAGTPGPGPALLTDDPANLSHFRAEEESTLTTYGWVDRNTGRYRIPIDRAKDLIVAQGGLPVRGETPAPDKTAKSAKSDKTDKTAASDHKGS